MDSNLTDICNIIKSDVDRVTRTRQLNYSFINILCVDADNRLGYPELIIPTYININQQLSDYSGEAKKNIFTTFLIDELIHQIKDLEDNVYDLETALMQIIGLGTLKKLTIEFNSFNKSMDLSKLYLIHKQAIELFHNLLKSGDNGGYWNIFKSTNGSPSHYRFHTNDEGGYNQVLDKKEIKDVVSLMLETTYIESANGAADFLILNNGLTAWSDKKFYL